MSAFAFLAQKRMNRESHRGLNLLLLAQAEPKVVEKQLATWEDE
jgi:hypothetical protein